MTRTNAINRSIIQAGMGYDDADMQPPLYFKTTNEMLEEFAYLGAEKCHEVVIDNPRKIADQVDKLQLFPKHPRARTPSSRSGRTRRTIFRI